MKFSLSKARYVPYYFSKRGNFVLMTCNVPGKRGLKDDILCRQDIGAHYFLLFITDLSLDVTKF